MDLKKQLAAAPPEQSISPIERNLINPANEPKMPPSIFNIPLRGNALRAKMRISHHEIRQDVLETNSDIIPRTSANNRKCTYESLVK